MKDFIWAFVVLGFSWLAFTQGHRAGWNEGHHEERKRCEFVIADRVAKGIAGFKRVQGIREQSEYNRGRESCHE